MKRVTLSLCLFAASSCFCVSNAQDITNKGTLYISNSSDVLYIGSAFSNTVDASLTNNGTIYLKGALTNDQAAMPASSGSLVLNGGALQVIQGTEIFKTYNLSSSNSSGIRLYRNLQVLNNVFIENGVFDIDSMKLVVGGNISNQGTISAKKGSLELSGSSSQTIAGIFQDNIVRNLIISNEAGVTLNGQVNITNEVTIAKGRLNTQGYLTLKSTATSTARIPQITSSDRTPISGSVTVERYMSANRAFRLLTSPVNTAGGIRANWMENTNNTAIGVNLNPVPGYGTHVSGPGGSSNGFDVTVSNNPSLFTYTASNQTWASMLSTSGKLYAGTGYRLMVRGDRTIDLNNNNAPATPTILRTTGTILSGNITIAKPGGGGTVGMPEIASTNLGYSLIGNPYASPVNWNTVTKSDISPTIYIYDPTLLGANGRGAFVTYNELLGTNNNPSSQADNFIQAGQAFMVQTTGANPTITFKESDKTDKIRQVFRTSKIPKLTLQLYLPRHVNKGTAADAVSAFFHQSFSDSIGIEDSYKFTNSDENIAIEQKGKLFSIAGRKPLNTNDTLNLRLWQLTQKAYIFKSALSNFDPATEAYLEDKWQHTYTRLYNDSAQQLPFSITADPASSSADRFRIIFNNTSPQHEAIVSRGSSAPQTGGISVYPNPVQKSTINLFLNNSPSGPYTIALINTAGQVVYNAEIKHDIKSPRHTIEIPKQIKGEYMLRLLYADEVKTISLMID